MHLTIDVPDNIFFGINETEQSLTQLLKQKLATELYKSHQVSLSQASSIATMDLYAFMDLLSQNHIPVIDDYDIEEEISTARRLRA